VENSEFCNAFFYYELGEEWCRRLRVSLEHDFGGSNEAAKIIRLFVPYWLLNDASLPLAYRLVEIEPDRGLGGDATWLTRAAKAAKQAARRPNHAGARKVMQINRVVQHLECIEDLQGTPVMLSLQAYSDHMSGLSLSSRSEDGLLSPRLGLSVAIAQSNVFNHALSFRDFENSMERVNLNAVNSSGAYYKLSVFLDMSSDRTKVIHVQPHTLFVNRIGQRLSLRQGDITYEELLYPNDPPKSFLWQSTRELELLKVLCVNHSQCSMVKKSFRLIQY
jgi:vacuolar protein sorting-associated protein 13A/C